MNPRTRWLLFMGTLAGPVFVVSSLLQALLRAGFDLREQPPSALSLGDVGWVQRATFVVAGLLFLAGARGLQFVIIENEGRWTPRFLAVFGLALCAGGLFAMDPAFGFPPGTPDGVGNSISWHAAIHGVLFPLGFASILAAGWSLSRRYAVQQRPLWRWAAIAIAPIALVLSILPNLGGPQQGQFLPLWLGVVVAFGWVSLMFGDAARSLAPSETRLVSERTP